MSDPHTELLRECARELDAARFMWETEAALRPERLTKKRAAACKRLVEEVRRAVPEMKPETTEDDGVAALV